MPFPLRLFMVFAISVPATAAQAQYRCAGYPPGTETTIAVYTNVEGTECAGETTNGMLTGSIWVNLAGAAAGGITGAEYRVLADGFGFYTDPVLFSISFSPNPDAVLNLGDPFHGGTNTVFNACQSPRRVRIGTFLLIEPTPEPIALYVREHESPSNYVFCCPLVTLCDGPVFTKVCATGISNDHDYDPDEILFAGVNMKRDGWAGAGRCPIQPFGSPTGVTEATWTTLKSLYR